MAFLLSADKRNFMDLFSGQKQYVIPAYQRGYSWSDKEILQMCKDLLDAFNADEEYFLGNILLSRGVDDTNTLRIVDGQQRMVTILIMLKLLSVMYPDIPSLKEFLKVRSWDGTATNLRVISENTDVDDDAELNALNDSDLNTIECDYIKCYNPNRFVVVENKCHSRVNFSAMVCYDVFRYQYNQDREKFKLFVKYFLTRVFLLPIELTDDTSEKAEYKAQKIFQTLNNRGANLSDADIFKSTLFKKAYGSKDYDLFKERWNTLIDACADLNIEVETVFRYYSHAVRCEKGIIGPEPNLQDFYLNGDTPLTLSTPVDFVGKLLKTVEVLFAMQAVRKEPTEACAWMQVIDAYSNRFPQYAVFAYIYKYGNDICESQLFVNFLKSLARLCYSQGATTSVKFPIYEVIAHINKSNVIDHYCHPGIVESDIILHDRLKKGLTLIAFYMHNKKAVLNYTIDTILRSADISITKNSPNLDCLGNMIVTDLKKRFISACEKKAYYSKSGIEAVSTLFQNNVNAKFISERNKKIITDLLEFFEKPTKDE